MPPVTFALWISLVWGAGWFFFPCSRRIFSDVLPDAGLAIGRVLFLTAWTMGAFWAGYAGLAVRLGALGWIGLALMGLAFWKRDHSAIQSEIRLRKRAIGWSETIFLGVFLLFFVLRGFWSDTSGTNGEKSMDNALISSLVRSDRLPPPNPFAAGARLNSYYYFGHLQTALLTDAVHSHPRWTYNLMCATLPSLCFSVLFSLGAALTKRLKGGLFCSISVLGLGTLQPIYQWLHPQEFTPSAPFHLDFFAVSRVIPYSINEFPFFTFNQADLHAHYFDLPLALATIGTSYALFRGRKAAIWPATLLLGAQISTNTWDFPAYALLLGLAIWSGSRHQEPLQDTDLVQNSGLTPEKRSPIARLALAWGGALALATPYLLHIKTAAGSPKWLGFPASPLREWLLLWGIFAAAWLAFLAYSVYESRRLRGFGLGLGAIFLIYSLLIPWQQPDRFTLPLIAILLAVSIGGALRLQGEARFLCFLAIGGLCALMWSETTWAGFLGDAKHLGFDDYKRQDTVFKFGLQTWILWGVAASCGAVLSCRKWPLGLQMAFMPLLSIMAMASVAVVFGRARGFADWESWTNFAPRQKMAAILGKTPSFWKWDGWDGWAHLAPGEKLAAQWLVQNVVPGENILEAEQKEGGDYSPFARYASATGIPTIIGPQAHTFQWSPANSGEAGREWDEVFRRKAQAREIYTLPDNVRRSDELRAFGVKFVVFGELEQQQYGPGALETLLSDPNLALVAHFETPGAEAQSDGSAPHDVKIFRVK